MVDLELKLNDRFDRNLALSRPTLKTRLHFSRIGWYMEVSLIVAQLRG